MSTVSRARGRLLNIKDAAAYLSTTERHMRRLLNERRIPSYKLGSGRSSPVRFDTADLEDWLAEHHRPAE